jgi:thiamine-monophosphate kinase
VKNVKLSELGERYAHRLTRNILSEGTDDELKIEDDCAALDFGDYYFLITTDIISQVTHIPAHATPWQIGWHAIAINLSDIASMGGEPLGIVAALGLPASLDEAFFSELVTGAGECAKSFGTSIVGGDTKESETLTLSGCAFGRVPKSEILRRKGAQPGDLVCVTGELGKAGWAYYALKTDPENKDAIADLLKITPRLKEGRILAQSESVTSCMDISDGLASSIHQMSRLNELGYEIDLKLIPVYQKALDASNKMEIPIEDLTIYFGGDYELLFTVTPGDFESFSEKTGQIATPFTRIGRVLENHTNTLIKDDTISNLEDRGYEHFRWNR